MRILLIDCIFSLSDADNITFESSLSCFDYDLVVWDIEGTMRRYRSYRPYVPVSEGSSFLAAYKRRKAEFDEFTRLGRNLMVFPATSDTLRVNVGRTVRTAAGSSTSLSIGINGTLPFELSVNVGRGSAIQPRGIHTPSLWRQAKDWFVYRGFLTNYPGDPAFTVKGTDKVVGSIQKCDSGGWIFVMPEPWCPRPFDEDYDSPQVTDGGWLEAPRIMVDWAVSLTNQSEEEKPDWAEDYRFTDTAERVARLVKLNNELEQILAKIDSVKAEQAEDDLWKVLIYGQGPALEKQVSAAFELLGFSQLEAVDGRADLRLSWDGQPLVVEVKGLTKSAAEKNAAQLEKWVSEEISSGANHPKAILVANTWREARPDERTEVSFPNQMHKYARDRNHCLVTGAQLLSMVRTVMRHPEKKAEIVSELMSTVGPVAGWESDSILTRITNDDPAVEDAPPGNSVEQQESVGSDSQSRH
ncbi:hypothetical protein [Streptomyces mirabilis]|uniref:hypothetical protein n=1 Tax=Streptomyces mirabilis TaxID=68239 RepID=UPI0036D948BD